MSGSGGTGEYGRVGEWASGSAHTPTPPHPHTPVPPHQPFIEAATRLGLNVVANEPLARHTTFRIGGPADLYVAVNDVEKLPQTAELARAHGIPYIILGGGSNILVSDAGVRGLVIANQSRGWRLEVGDRGLEVGGWRLDSIQPPTSNFQLVADSGVALAGLARWAIREGWAGLEWAVSVPGTVGGAVIGNAGAHGGCIADSLAWTLIHDVSQGRRALAAAELGYSYRSSVLKDKPAEDKPGFSKKPGLCPPIVLSAAFNVTRGDVAEMTARADGFLARRRASQPVEPSAGSVFRNPPGDHAGRLIEAVGLKGHRLGGAQISPRHANFIINTGAARSSDVLGLIRLAQKRVYEQFGIELTLEIVLPGDSAALSC